MYLHVRSLCEYVHGWPLMSDQLEPAVTGARSHTGGLCACSRVVDLIFGQHACTNTGPVCCPVSTVIPSMELMLPVADKQPVS